MSVLGRDGYVTGARAMGPRVSAHQINRVAQDRAAAPVLAVLAPCYDEALTIAGVVKAFAAELPGAAIYVYDNNSTDGTVAAARAAGAVVRTERTQGKGAVVRRMFADIEADVYIMVDGDGTYDAASAPEMVRRLIEDDLDMVNGARKHSDAEAYRAGHQFGNRMLTGLVAWAFGARFKDMLSGYRVMSRRFVKSFPALSDGFEIETELTVHALRLRLPTAEVDTPYYARPEGSASKLNTIRDGTRILRVIGRMVRDEKPLEFFSAIGVALWLIAALLLWPLVQTYLETGLVPRFPTLIGAIGLAIIGALSITVGLVLDTLSRLRVEARRIAYLAAARAADRRV